ncbi:RNA polymerase sigma factor [Nocardioides sp.]|uniref:RNA polymerase sigma factor n=1 Tax=Nocardioides sp. TaxID=35761 RepID=UPI002611DB42|nr:RNA polymerase sigma factor [Nocardioides sp.]
MIDSVREQRLADLYDRWAARVHAYAVRHCGVDGADDVVSETFIVAWRRLDVVPEEALPWLLVVARNTIAHRHRAIGRRSHLEGALQDAAAEAGVVGHRSAEEIATARLETIQALQGLSAKEREAVLLIAWDGLTIAAAAEVAGCRSRAFRARLTRARAHLRAALEPASEPPHLRPVQEPAS